MSDNTYNIPTMSTGTMAKQLTELYTQAYRNHTLPFLPSVALWGPMGVGKSTAVKTIAENLSKIKQITNTVKEGRSHAKFESYKGRILMSASGMI